MNFKIAEQRSSLYKKIRNFFDSRGYLEVETPLLSENLIPESTIDCFSTTFINEYRGNKELFLVPSPEIYIKKLIANGSGSVYEISKCFRNCEQIGKIHNPEFTMLEYYTTGYDEKDSISLTQQLLSSISTERTEKLFHTEPLILSVREAVLQYCKLDIDILQKSVDLRKEATKILNIKIPNSECWEDTFNRLFCTFVETSIPKDRIVIFTDYPAQIDCLAKREKNYRRRWEMYLEGIEIANCYFEENDSLQVSTYFETQQAKLISERFNTDKVIPDSDPNYHTYFKNFPKCSGVAIGLDRLLMVLHGYSCIQDVLLF